MHACKGVPIILGRSKSKRREVSRILKICETLGPLLEMRHGWPRRKTPLYHLLYRAKFGLSRSNITSVITEILRKMLTLRVPPLMVAKDHWNRPGFINYLWLLPVIHSNPGLVLYRFWNERRFSVENRKFHLRKFNARGFPEEFCNSAGARKIRKMSVR